MKTEILVCILIVLLFGFGCESKTEVTKKCKIIYLTDSYKCADMQYPAWGLRGVNCISFKLGIIVKQVDNPTNVIQKEVCE